VTGLEAKNFEENKGFEHVVVNMLATIWSTCFIGTDGGTFSMQDKPSLEMATTFG